MDRKPLLNACARKKGGIDWQQQINFDLRSNHDGEKCVINSSFLAEEKIPEIVSPPTNGNLNLQHCSGRLS